VGEDVKESPIDALSHKQELNEKDNTLYICTCGSLTKGFKENIERVFAEANERGQKVILAFDNDLAGKRMQGTLEKMAEEAGVMYYVHAPQLGKDWNEALMEGLGQQAKAMAISVQVALSKLSHDGPSRSDNRRRGRRTERDMGR
jgi:DNA primase